MELSVSVEASTGLVAVGFSEPGATMPRDVRVLEPELADLVARAVAARLAHPATNDSVDLDRMVAVSEAVVAARRVPAQGAPAADMVETSIPAPRAADRTIDADPWFSC